MKDDTGGSYTLILPGADSKRKTGIRPSADASLLEKWRAGCFIIVPEDNILIDMWDCVVIGALFITAVELPFEVALILEPSEQIYLLGKAIDLIFSFDILLNFNLAYATSNPSSQDQYERDPVQIAAHYMAVPFSDGFQAGWFWPDVMTVVPWEAVPAVKDVSSLRLVRVLRLVRMLRLVRVLKLFKRWQTQSGFSYALVRVMFTAACTLLLVHWLACIWAHLGLNPSSLIPGDPEANRTWLEQHVRRQKAKELHEISIFEAYISALYLCVVVLVTVGFGDIVPVNEVEIMAMVATIFTTGITWAWVVANVVNVITQADVFANQFNQIMDDLNALMSAHKVNKTLRHRIRRHLHESYPVHRRRHNQNSIKTLSSGLQGELAIRLGMDEVCHCVWYLRDLQEGVLIEIAAFFGSELFSPAEFIMDRNVMHVVRRGTCIRNGKVLSRDAVLGEDMILLSEHLKDTSVPRTLTSVEVMTLARDDLKAVCLKFPDFDRRLRRAQVKMALWRAFVHVAAQIKKTNGARGGPQRRSQWDMMEDGAQGSGRGGGGSLLKVQSLKNNEVGWSDSIRAQPMRRIQDDPAAQALAEIRELREIVESSVQQGEEQLQSIHRKGDAGRQETLMRLDKLEKHFDTLETKFNTIETMTEVVMPSLPGTPGNRSQPTSPQQSKSRFR